MMQIMHWECGALGAVGDGEELGADGVGLFGVGCEVGVGAFGDDVAFSGGWRSPSGMGKLAAEGAHSVVSGVVIG
jgi:hypothetical protein